MYMKSVFLLLGVILIMSCAGPQDFELKEGDRIAIIGNSLAERMQHDGWLETYLQSLHPTDSLVFRNLGYSGDQIHYRPRSHEGFGDSDAHLSDMDATVIFAFFGYNESFNNTPEAFIEKVSSWIDYMQGQQYDSENNPRIVLFSPIAHENLETPNLPDGEENNERLAVYSSAMSEVAREKGVRFIDLFAETQKLYEEFDSPLTINGVHLNERGNQQVGLYIAEQLSGRRLGEEGEFLESLRSAVKEKNKYWFRKYRAVSGNDIWGIRSRQDGNYKTLQRELEMLEVMTANRDKQVWARAQGEDIAIDDSNVPDPVIVGTHITRNVEYLDPVEAIDRMTIPDDLEVNLYASEEEFPEIANPVALQADTKGRVWVASWADYPKWQPGTPMRDRLVYLTDTNGDGRADEVTTFAYVSHPTGFEFWNDGVIVASAPYILYLKDTTGDGKADHKVRMFGGIGADDTHHAANNLIYGPDGWIYYQRGIFILENVETPWRISEESGTPGLYRFNPRTFDYSFVVDNTPNPHGISFDKWGHQYITDGTTGSTFQVYYNRTVTASSDVNEFEKRPLFEPKVRPVTSNQILSSAHFPDHYQNNFLIYNAIGFQGIKRYALDYNGQGVVEGREVGNLVFTGDDPTFAPRTEARPRVFPEDYKGDPNFRPTDGVMGADGALYFGDWQNAVITHSPYNLRDFSRDKNHGRIYRITAKGRPLQEPNSIDGEPIEELLELFKHPVDKVRHQVRVELSGRDSRQVIEKAREWVSTLDPQKEEDALPMLEILWLHQQHNIENRELLVQVMQSPVEQARIAAQRVAWFWSEREIHKRGSTDSTISGMQFRTYYEPWWDTNDKDPSELEEAEVTVEEVEPTSAAIPPSQRVALDNKGVGPVTELNLPDEIDPRLVSEGRELFESSCMTCHVADERLVGPALKGILEKRSPEWVMNFTINPSEMLAEDPLAKELLDEFDGIQMTNLGISREESRAILEYIRSL